MTAASLMVSEASGVLLKSSSCVCTVFAAGLLCSLLLAQVGVGGCCFEGGVVKPKEVGEYALRISRTLKVQWCCDYVICVIEVHRLRGCKTSEDVCCGCARCGCAVA